MSDNKVREEHGNTEETIEPDDFQEIPGSQEEKQLPAEGKKKLNAKQILKGVGIFVGGVIFGLGAGYGIGKLGGKPGVAPVDVPIG